MPIDKIILTNGAALSNKYGAAGLKKIQAAIKKMIAADKKRLINANSSCWMTSWE